MDKPMSQPKMLDHLHTLSRFCGLQHSMLPSVLRRGSAYILAHKTTVSLEERCTRMGHSHAMYWAQYRNTTSTTDVQALRHNIDPENVAMMSSIFLNTGNTNVVPPTQVSADAMAQVYQNPELNAFLAESSDVADQLVIKYGSVRDAQHLNPDGFEKYAVLRRRYHSKLQVLKEKQFRIEYKRFWETLGAHPIGDAADSQPLPAGDHIDRLLDEQEAEDNSQIDSAQFEEQKADTRDALAAFVTDLDEAEAAQKEAGGDPDYQLDDVEPTDKQQQHGHPGKARYDFRQPARRSLVDQVPRYLYDQPSNSTWNTLSAYFVDVFNCFHGADQFYPGHEPFPGTWNCRFCGEHFADLSDPLASNRKSIKREGRETPQRHALHCEAKYLVQSVMDHLQERDAHGSNTTCPLLRDKDGTLAVCSWSVKQGSILNHHMRTHHCIKSRGGFCCFNHGSADPVVFSSIVDFKAHMVVAHGAPFKVMQSESDDS